MTKKSSPPRSSFRRRTKRSRAANVVSLDSFKEQARRAHAFIRENAHYLSLIHISEPTRPY